MRRGEGMVRGAAGGGRGPGLQGLRARNGSHAHYSKAYGAAEGFKPGSDVIQFELSWVAWIMESNERHRRCPREQWRGLDSGTACGGRDVDTLKTYCRGRNDEALQSNKLARLHKLQSTVRALSATVGSLSPLS